MMLLNCQLLPSPRNLSAPDIGIQRGKKASEHYCNEKKPSSTSQPSSFGYLLQDCTRERSLQGGLQLHAHMIKTGIEADPLLQSHLLSLYIKCECTDFARMAFDTFDLRTNLISWNSMITMYSRSGLIEEALMMFLDLQRHGLQPDQFTLSVVIGTTEQRHDILLGMQVHSLAIKLGYEEEEFVGNSLIQMYAMCERITDSFRVFEAISETTSPVAWNSMISRLTESGTYRDGLELYKEMQTKGLAPTPLTFSSLLRACANLESIFMGRQVHTQFIVRGFSSNVILETALVDLYFKFGELQTGRKVFEKMEMRNVITWNSIIKGYSEMGLRTEAMKLFQEMRRGEIFPDKFTITALLSGKLSGNTAENSFPEELITIHAYIIKVGLEADPFIGSSLITMYSTNQSFEDARILFDDRDSTDPIVWSSMITSSMKNGEGEDALRLFTEMLNLDIEPNQFIYSSLFMAFSYLSMLEMGKQIHAYGLKSSSSSFDVATKNSLLTMYSSCGCIDEAWKIFYSIKNPNLISFNSMISALAQHGSPKEAIELFERMKLYGLRPDEITLLSLLSALNHSGLIDEGLKIFNAMEESHGIKPRYQHHACIVDMLARAGEIKEAIRFISKMPFEPEPALWRIILGACGKHRNIKIGRQVAELLFELEPDEATNYVLAGNVYARAGRWSEADRIRHMMVYRGIEREEGVSWIEINRKIHTFRVEDWSHPLSEEIYTKLQELIWQIKAAGYLPDISFALHDMEDERKEESLCYHSEKLAFAFAVLSTAQGITVRIMKNIRICGDCHSAFKSFSLITGREIILRDNCRFHHFKCGVCSCGDYW